MEFGPTLDTSYLIGPGKHELFTLPTFMDPPFFVINGDFLLDLMKGGAVKVLPRFEAIDGSECIIIEGEQSIQGGFRKFRVWLDPHINCCPRKVEQTVQTGTEKWVGTWDIKNYKEVIQSVWIPYYSEMNSITYDPQGQKKSIGRNIMEVETCCVGKPSINTAIEIPDDKPVYDRFINKMIWPKSKGSNKQL